MLVSKTEMMKVVNFAKKHKKLLITLAVIIILILSTQRRSNSVKPVQVDQVKYREVIKNITATGETTVKKEYSIRAPVGAKILQIMNYSGDAINKGDIIIKLDESSLKSSTETAFAAYLTAKAAVDSYDEQVDSAKRSAVDKKLVRDEAWREYMADNGEDNKQT